VHSTGLEELGAAEATKENNMKSQKTQKETVYTIATLQREAGNEKLTKITNSRTDIENPKSCDHVSTGYGLAMSVVHHRQGHKAVAIFINAVRTTKKTSRKTDPQNETWPPTEL